MSWLKGLFGARTSDGDGQAVALAQSLLSEAEEDSEDPRSLNLTLDAARIYLGHGKEREVVGILIDLLGYRWQFGYYSTPQVDKIKAFIDEWLDAHNDRWRLRALAARVHGSVVGGGVGELLAMIAERQVVLGDFDDARASMDRLVAMTGDSQERWDIIRRDGLQHFVENKIRAKQGLPPLPRPPYPPHPERSERPPRDPAEVAREEAESAIRKALEPVMDLMNYRYDLGFYTDTERADAERTADELIARYASTEELRALAFWAHHSRHHQFALEARIALELARRGDMDQAREVQRWIAEPVDILEWGTAGNNERRKSAALDLLDPVLGAVERRFTTRRFGDDDYALDVAEEVSGPLRWRPAATSTCNAAMLRLARGELDRAESHVLEALDRATKEGSLALPPNQRQLVDQTTRVVLAARRTLREWREHLLSPEAMKTWGFRPRFILLGWIGVEQARQGDVAEARLIRDAIAATEVESWDDMELHFDLETRDGAVARIDAAIAR